MIKVAIEEIWELVTRKIEINAIPLDEIVFTERGVELKISDDVKREFIFTGLTNIDFITSGYYMDGIDEPKQGHDPFGQLHNAIQNLIDLLYREMHIPQLARWLNDKLTTISRWLQ